MHGAPADSVSAIYERALRSLLWRLRPRRLQWHVDFLLRRALQFTAANEQRNGLAELYRLTRVRVINRLRRRQQTTPSRASSRAKQDLLDRIPARPHHNSPDFHCDSALGGLARWLRAAGYDAAWWPGIDDDELLRKSLASSAIMLTTDRPLAERGVIRAGLIPALLVPVSLNRLQQFHFVRDQLQLPIRQPRCMQCGGQLQTVHKEEVREQIPPRTYPWIDDYWQCERCQKLYWKGTHWQRIEHSLNGLHATTRPSEIVPPA